MLGGIASRKDTTVLGTPYSVLVRGTRYGSEHPREGAGRALVGAAPGLGTPYNECSVLQWQLKSSAADLGASYFRVSHDSVHQRQLRRSVAGEL